MLREDVDHALAVVRPAAGRDAVPDHDLLALVVHRGPEEKAPLDPRAIDRPAGEGACDFGDVALRVAAVDAERVQLHQLARVVLVEARLPAAAGSPRNDVVGAG